MRYMDYSSMDEALRVLVEPQQSHALGITDALARLDEAARDDQLKRTHPHLRHYLQNRSYQKAHAYLRQENLVETEGR